MGEYNMAMGNSSKLLLSGLGFFRMMNFTKPDDSILRLLKSCGGDTCMIRAFLTVDGMTQLSLRLHSSSSLFVDDVSSDDLRQFYAMLGGDPILVEFTMDSQGHRWCESITNAAFPLCEHSGWPDKPGKLLSCGLHLHP